MIEPSRDVPTWRHGSVCGDAKQPDDGIHPAAKMRARKINRKRWLIAASIFLTLAIAIYVQREAFVRAVTAFGVYRAHAFTPPSISNEPKWRRMEESARFYWDFAAFITARQERLRLFEPTIKPLVKEIVRRQSEGQEMQYSMNIYREIRWLLNYTADTGAIEAQIAALRDSLTLPESQQRLATEQQSSDGSWGMGFTSWYFRLYYSVDHVEDCQGKPRYPFSFLDRVNSPEKLQAVLNSYLMDDFTKTGQFNEDELNESSSALARILFKSKPTTCYAFDPGVRDAFADFVARWQNPSTGWWGQWLIDRQGKVWKMDDTSITFHIITALHGHVPHLDLAAKHLLQVDSVDFPAGLRFNGHYENHLNWDAVTMFRYAWPSLDVSAREQARAEISNMLRWCLTESLQPDGSFKVSDLDDTLGDAYEYGVSFLVETGYFDRQRRFWTNQDFPDADAVRARIEAKLKSTGLHGGLRNAYETLITGQD
jgi:hypothetical protein